MQDTQNNVYNEIGVSVEDANNPVFIFDDSSSSSSFGVTVFQTFINSAAAPTLFDIPKICSEH